MANFPDSQARTVLPIPDKAYAGPILYDAKNPDVSFPPIQPLLPPEGVARAQKRRTIFTSRPSKSKFRFVWSGVK